MSLGSTGRLADIALESLHPDWNNPRFPPSAADNFETDLDVYAYLDRQFDAASVAESIFRHGFFLSEPLIVIPSEHPDAYTVVEGNRRLAALKGLSDPEVRARMTDSRWKNMGFREAELANIPVLIADSREAVAPILGYRHVTGIAPWDPFQQARYVASLIDEESSTLSASDVAQLIGRDVSEVRAFYRNYSIVEQARDLLAVPDPDRIVEEFGVWTRAMTSIGIRQYISAPSPREVVEGTYPLPDDVGDELGKLITWIFGRPRAKEEVVAGRQSKEGRVISDSRQITRLGKVLLDPSGRESLELGGSLPDAEAAILDPSARFYGALEATLSNLRDAVAIATPDLVRERDADLDHIQESLKMIRSVR